MKRIVEMTLMLLGMTLMTVMMGTTLTSCSSTDEDSPEVVISPTSNVWQGYWLDARCDEEDLMNQHGLLFKADSTIYYWVVTPETWDEMYWGRLGRTRDDGGWLLEIPITDNDYRIKSLNESQLVIEHLNGWTMERTDFEYKKMRFGPVYVN